MSEWKPIKTAPKERTVILAAWDYGSWFIQPAKFFNGEWVHGWDHDPIDPTHWMPLPKPPKSD